MIGEEEKRETIEVRFPWDNSLIAEVPEVSTAEIDDALEAATAARRVVADLSRAERRRILERVRDIVADRSEDLARTIVSETGKTIRDSRGEIARAISTLEFAAAAAANLTGEVLPLDALDGEKGRWGWTERVPIGVVAGIPAVNFPFLLAVHKLAPAIGAGCPIAIKPPDRAPLAVLELGRIAVEAGWPEGAVHVLPGAAAVGEKLVTDSRVKLVTFTGSSKVGEIISRMASMKPVMLELGSNAATVIAPDANVEVAVGRCRVGGFSHNGQSCISVQRVYIHEDLYEDVTRRIAERAAGLRVGDPRDEATDVGPVIDEASATRIEGLISDARDKGGEVLTGGKRDGSLIEPTVVAGLTPEMRLHREEVFGPVVATAPFKTLDEVIELVNDSEYGLQAGVFTENISFAREFARRCEVGGVHINEVSTWRADHMPYGGVKASGLGREGPAYAMQEMTTLKVVSVRDLEGASA